MKKIMYVAMVALAFMACNQNSPELPKDEQKATVLVSDSVFNLINQPLATVHKAMLDAGYKYAEPNKMASLSKKIFKDLITNESRSYVMGMDPDSLSSNTGMMYEMNKAMNAGKNIEMVTVRYMDGECVSVNAQVIVPASFNITEFYLNRTQAMCKILEAMPIKNFSWTGTVGSEDKEQRTEYLKRDAFAAAVKGKKGIQASEWASNIEIKQVQEGLGYQASLEVMSDATYQEVMDEAKKHPGELILLPYNSCNFIASEAGQLK